MPRPIDRNRPTLRLLAVPRPRLLPVLLAVAIALIALTSGCASDRADSAGAPPAQTRVASTTYPLTITDDASRSVTIQAEPLRIVSLAPANTEIVFAIGAGDRLVGVTSLDDYPAEVADIPKVGDFAGPNIEAVAAADPDLVLATTGVQSDVIEQLEGLGATVIAIDPQSLDGVYEDILEVAEVVNKKAEGEELVASMKGRVEDIANAVSGRDPVTVFIEIAQDPLFTAGRNTLLDELVTRAGGVNVVRAEGWVPYSPEEVVKADPDVYLATKGSMSNPEDLAKRPGFKGLAAVKAGRVVILDDNLVSRPGPRIVSGLEDIARALHPEAFGQ